VPSAVAASVFVTALGSSSVADLARFGRPARWVALILLLGVAATAWVAHAGRLPRPRGPVGAGASLVVLAAGSALWSVQPRLTIERGLSFGLVLLGAGLAAYAAAGTARFAERLVYAVVAGAAAVCLGGLPLLLVDHSAAVHAASVGVPARYQGLGQSPNTVSLLLAVAVPLATWIAVGRHRLLGLATLLLFWATLAASASRGGLIGAAVGALVVVALQVRPGWVALSYGGAVCAVFAVAVAAGSLARPGTATSSTPAAPAPTHGPYVDVERVYPLEDDLGRSLPGAGDVEGGRTLLGSSGRTAVWDYALGQVLERPVAGYGFGTEEKVFADRFAGFEGARVENSYIGWLLQLGTVGLAAFAACVGAAVLAGRRALCRGGFGTAAAGGLAGGLVVALVQSYVYAAGNIAALSFWLSAGLVAVAAVPSREAS
jgi:O-antigen ligase